MTEIIHATFEDVVSQESWDLACECKWHVEVNQEPAEWIIRNKRPCCQSVRVALICDPCLKAILAHRGFIKCRQCGETYFNGEAEVTYEPIHKDAA